MQKRIKLGMSLVASIVWLLLMYSLQREGIILRNWIILRLPLYYLIVWKHNHCKVYWIFDLNSSKSIINQKLNSQYYHLYLITMSSMNIKMYAFRFTRVRWKKVEQISVLSVKILYNVLINTTAKIIAASCILYVFAN